MTCRTFNKPMMRPPHMPGMMPMAVAIGPQQPSGPPPKHARYGPSRSFPSCSLVPEDKKVTPIKEEEDSPENDAPGGVWRAPDVVESDSSDGNIEYTTTDLKAECGPVSTRALQCGGPRVTSVDADERERTGRNIEFEKQEECRRWISYSTQTAISNSEALVAAMRKTGRKVVSDIIDNWVATSAQKGHIGWHVTPEEGHTDLTHGLTKLEKEKDPGQPYTRIRDPPTRIPDPGSRLQNPRPMTRDPGTGPGTRQRHQATGNTSSIRNALRAYGTVADI